MSNAQKIPAPSSSNSRQKRPTEPELDLNTNQPASADEQMISVTQPAADEQIISVTQPVDQATETPYRCKLCPRTFRTAQGVIGHQNAHKPSRTTRCDWTRAMLDGSAYEFDPNLPTAVPLGHAVPRGTANTNAMQLQSVGPIFPRPAMPVGPVIPRPAMQMTGAYADKPLYLSAMPLQAWAPGTSSTKHVPPQQAHPQPVTRVFLPPAGEPSALEFKRARLSETQYQDGGDQEVDSSELDLSVQRTCKQLKKETLKRFDFDDDDQGDSGLDLSLKLWPLSSAKNARV